MTRRKIHNGRNRRHRNRNNNNNNNHSANGNHGSENRENNHNENRNRHFREDRVGGGNGQSILPSPVILQEYEYAKEGAADRIIEMAETEQDRRNAWEDEYLRFYKKSLRIGQLFGFIIAIAVIIAVTLLANNGNSDVAKILCVSVFASFAATSIFSGRKRNKFPRKPKGRY